MTAQRAKRAAVVGAGLTGLTTAYRLQRSGWQVQLLEAKGRAGGRVQTIERDGYRIDTGASALADSYTAYLELAKELELGTDIVAVAPCIGIYRDGQVHELALDYLLSSGLRTRILTWPTKLRMLRLAWDICQAKWRGQLNYADMRRAAPLDTESADDYASRALGREAAEYFASPVVRTMLIADANKISKVEFFSGVANILAAQILTLRGGQGRLPQLLAHKLQPRLNHSVQQVIEQTDGVSVEYLDEDGRQHKERYDVCAVCCPLPEAMRICTDKRTLLEPLHTALEYTQCITVALALNRPPDCRAFLVQMPTSEDADIALLFLDHNKCADRVPDGRGLIDCHWEASAAVRMMNRPDAEIVAHTLATVLRVFPELQDQLAFSHVTRWRYALPRTAVGTYRRIGDFNASVDPRSRVQFGGDYLSAAGQNTAIAMGNRVAQRLSSLLI